MKALARACVALALGGVVALSGCQQQTAGEVGSDATAALKATDARTRIEAARNLGQAGDPSVVPSLVDALGDIRPDVRRAVVEALGEIGAPEAVGPLSRLLGDDAEDEGLRRAAAVALGRIQAPSGVPALEAALGSVTETLPAAAAHALAAIDHETSRAVLLSGCESESVSVRRACVAVLGKLAGGRSLDLLRGLLSDPDPMIKLAAAEGLLKRRDGASVDRVVALLRDPDDQVRKGIRRIAGGWGEAALPALDTLMRMDPRALPKPEQKAARDAQRHAVDLLVALETSDALELILHAVAHKIGDRRKAEEWLRSQVATPEGRAALLKAGRNASPSEQRLALTVFTRFVEETSDSSGTGRREALRAAGVRDLKTWIKLAALIVSSETDSTDLSAARLLCLLGDTRGRGKLLEAFQLCWPAVAAEVGRDKKSGEARSAAREGAEILSALVPVADRALSRELSPLLDSGGHRDRDKDLQRLFSMAVRIILRADDRERIPVLFKMFMDKPEPDLASHLAHALGTFGVEEAFDPIVAWVDTLINDLYFIPIRMRTYEGLWRCDSERASQVIGRIFVELDPSRHFVFEAMLEFMRKHPHRNFILPLAHYADHDIRASLEKVSETVAALGREHPDWMIEGFKVADHGKRSSYAGILADQFGPEALVMMAGAAGHKDPKVRQGAVWTVGCVGGSRAVEDVSAALRDEHPAVRSAALWAVGRMRERSLGLDAGDLLQDAHPTVRAAAAKQLGLLGSPVAIEPLTGVLTDEDPRVRAYAAISLAQLGAESALPVLRPMVEDTDPDVQTAAEYAVKALQPGARP